MDFQKFIQQLPEVYENWGLASMFPKNNQFEKILEQAEVKTNSNVLALLNFALDCLDNEEVYRAHKTGFTANSLKEKMEEAGLENVEVRQEWLNLWTTGYC